MLSTKLDHLKTFPGREAALRSITRYSLYPVMFYRSSLWSHAQHVAWIVRTLRPYAIETFGAAYDPERAEWLALVHDDVEIITGDFQAGNKSKMTPEQLAQIAQIEQEAIPQLAARYPFALGKYRYSDVLTASLDEDSVEHRVVMFADKCDAFGEALHEVFGGNELFTTPVVNEYGTIPIPCDYYIGYFARFSQKFPGTESFVAQDHPFMRPAERANFETLAKTSQPHTSQSVKQKRGYPHYDLWKELVLTYGDAEEKRHLYHQKEFKKK